MARSPPLWSKHWLSPLMIRITSTITIAIRITTTINIEIKEYRILPKKPVSSLLESIHNRVEVIEARLAANNPTGQGAPHDTVPPQAHIAQNTGSVYGPHISIQANMKRPAGAEAEVEEQEARAFLEPKEIDRKPLKPSGLAEAVPPRRGLDGTERCIDGS
ncbi:unnamed protein product [Parascedosporium putredinis]|uniref:Uncharacterized protein n=1 Tax=Parascedosporium putredinis TaxID=1442378 RepID=A0A9P1GVH7_9PEZI|nr:unnamed protein product [Parascedosporium putredinis]CAI7988472.1 unnamed protein product [Parascedosporium putredinis]